jgi:adenosine/AMP kinase
VKIEKPADTNFILGQTYFIGPVEDRVENPPGPML